LHGLREGVTPNCLKWVSLYCIEDVEDELKRMEELEDARRELNIVGEEVPVSQRWREYML